MNKIWKYFILFALLGALMCTAAFAVDEPTFTGVDDSTTKFTMDVSGEKFDVSYTGAASGDQYLILMVAEGEDSLYTIDDESIMYVNQDAAGEGGVSFTVYPTKMVNAKIMLGGFEDGPVTLGYLEMPAPDVTVNVVGASNTAEYAIDGTTLNVQNDQACVVVYTTDGGATYQALEATPNDDGGYDYDLSALPSGAEVSIAVKGDANGDGKITAADAAAITAMRTGKIESTALMNITSDANGDGKMTAADAAAITASRTGKITIEW